MRQPDNLGDLLFALCVNFLLYCALIIVFYMLVKFYLEETTHVNYEIDETDETEEKEISDDSSTLSQDRNPYAELKNLEIIKRILFCASGLIFFFSIWGLVQERILTQPYDGVFFENSYGLVFLNRLGGLILSFFLIMYFKIPLINLPLWEYSFPSVANMLSSWCQYEALKYVSFPTQMLAKAFKIVPVMLMGSFLYEKTYETYEYVAAAMIGFGLYLFIDSSETVNFAKNGFESPEEMNGAICGIFLLILYLFFDSFTGQFQTRMFHLNKKMSPLQMMLVMNMFSAVFSFVTLIHQEEFYSSLTFVINHPTIISHVLTFCICSTVGQLFIFHTVKSFGPVVFSIIMSSRILFSTLLSCFVYSHPITEMGIIGILIVFGTITFRTQKKLENKPLFFWKSEESKKEIVHEWHEHLDI